jgi:hypothetical protein
MYLRVCILTLGLLYSVSSAAQDLRGFYAGAALSRGTLDVRGTLSTPSFDGENAGFKLLGGYRFGDRLAAEGAYLDLGKQRRGSQAGELRALTMAAVGVWPISRVDLYGRAGLSYWESELFRDPGLKSRDSFVDPFVGIGVQYRLGRLGIRADFDLLALRLLNALDSAPRDNGWVESWSAGATWRFR